MTIGCNQHSSSSGVNQEAEGSFSPAENMNINVLISNSSNNNSKRVCRECHKEFETGKSLGGHMRIHSKKQPIPPPRSDQSFPCFLCSSVFPSSRALSGHMRCHPGRNWTGIRPPSWYNWSDEDESEEEDDDDGDMVVDCLQQMSNQWPVKARRGGKGKSIGRRCEDDEDRAAAGLLLLKQVVYSDPWRLGALDAVGPAAAAAGRVAENHRVEIQSHGMSSGLNQSEKAAIGSSVEAAASPVPTNNYQCSNCHKTFSSYQALGGHMCNHHTQTGTQALAQPQLAVGSSAEEVSPRVGVKRIRLMGFDVIVPASMVEDAA